MIKEIDCKGLSCPIPVVNTKRALKENPEGLVVVVDNIAAKENVSRFATALGYTISVTEDQSNWKIQITK